MSKLARLKTWLTLAEAARELTEILEEPCTPEDVLRLGLFRQLVLSVRFSPESVLRLFLQPTIVSQASTSETAEDRSEWTFSFLGGIWDLALTGSERESVEARCQGVDGYQWSAARSSRPVHLSRNGDIWELSSRGLPPDCDIIVRSEALAELAARERVEKIPGHERELGTRSRNTLLTVIAAVCSLAKIDIAERGVATKILGAAERLGIQCDLSTISNTLNEIPEAVERRKRN
jgi:hypothetical protein